eukprot:COSAG01_NODE_2203_length_8173_cov_8.387293_1_plen_73_part_00
MIAFTLGNLTHHKRQGHSAPGWLPTTVAPDYLLLTLRIDPRFSVFTCFSGTGGNPWTMVYGPWSMDYMVYGL